MKKLLLLSALGAIVVSVMVFSVSPVRASIPHLINYQGVLTDDSDNPITDTLDIEFKIYDSETNGNLKWSETQSQVSIIDGLFNVILGSVNPIDTLSFSEDYWLEIKVGTETMLTRLRFTSVAYAYRAEMADTADYARTGGTADNDWHYRVTDTGDITLITGGRWGIARYGNELYGNADSTHVNLGVACTTGRSGYNNKYCTVGGGSYNRAGGQHATIGGGYSNTADYTYATVGGGRSNDASWGYATVGGGESNTASNQYTTVGGGYSNNASGYLATVGGGISNASSDTGATVGGGWDNTASGLSAAVGGGKYNVVAGDYSAILGGYADTISATADYSYLFGIKSKLTADSTFMVDMPHIRFGDEANGYEFPTSDGSDGEVMATDGSGQLSWIDVSSGWVDDGTVVRLETITDSVGIGTNSPTEKLDVEGNIHASGTITSGSSLTIDGVNDKITATSGKIDFEDEDLVTTGKVGIGITSPSEKLEVAGNIHANGTITSGTSLTIDGVNDKITATSGEIDFDNEDLVTTGKVICSVLQLTGGSDLSEQFDIKTAEVDAKPGMLVCIDPEHPGELIVSRKSYDRTVAGIISGAGGIETGMLMGQKGSEVDGSYPVALTGRVYCWADASNGSIRPGDLLTTSDTPGHAMRVTDYTRAQGAVIGKAMSSLEEGEGLVLILVTLQ